MNASHSHIVAIRRAGVIDGHQLRFDGGGPGKSRYFSSGKHGGPDQALAAARAALREMGLSAPKRRGGSKTGAISRLNTSGAAGIRFAWDAAQSAPILRVVASWTDRNGRARNTSYSVEYSGLDGALDKALAARTSAGAAMPDRAMLLERLREAHRTGGRVPPKR